MRRRPFEAQLQVLPIPEDNPASTLLLTQKDRQTVHLIELKTARAQSATSITSATVRSRSAS
jgi:hypothetical protein